MELFIFFILSAASGAYFTSVGCRVSQAKHRRAGWHHVLLGPAVTALLTVLLIGQRDLFFPSRWITVKISFWYPITLGASASAIIAFIASVIVVLVSRANFRDANPVA
jgi:hypothetical protein